MQSRPSKTNGRVHVVRGANHHGDPLSRDCTTIAIILFWLTGHSPEVIPLIYYFTSNQ